MASIPIGNPPITQEWLGIWYVPFGNEPDPMCLSVVKRETLRPWCVVPADPAADPFVVTEELLQAYAASGEGRRVYLFIPGQTFDQAGTRRGRGGGWYDRFLSRLPSDWLKIGIVPPDTKTDVLLERRSWDIPMDWLLLE